MKRLVKDEEKVLKLIVKLLSFLGKQDMWGIDIIYALCYAQADVMCHTLEDLDEEKAEIMTKHLQEVTAVAIKAIRKSEEEDEK